MSSISRVALLWVAFHFVGVKPLERAREPGTIRRVATLHTPRAAHTATTLPSGDVLFVGGMAEGGGSLSSVERFDPGDNSIREVEPLATSRVGHTATLLSDGRVLVAGGYNGDYLASLEAFDPSTNRFRPAGSLLEARSGHTATLLPDGRILFAGGVGRGWTFLRSAEIFDPRTGRSQLVGSMTLPRESHTATLLQDGRVLIVGGHSGRRQSMTVYSSAEIFSPQRGGFQATGSLGTARHKHDVVQLTDGRVLVIGGADRTDRVYFATTEIYNPGTGTFESGPAMASRRYKIAGTSVRLGDGSVLVTSGAEVPELFDTAHRRFLEVQGRLAAALRFAAAVPLANGDVVIAGGYDDANHNHSGVWRYAFRRAPAHDR
ncbi:MAG TPA: kelch repeat-containing protein [Gemmatimonadaceae bacterium]|nr:kelch repeat-containing protein [Gemmatimonadaceae bacterium]